MKVYVVNARYEYEDYNDSDCDYTNSKPLGVYTTKEQAELIAENYNNFGNYYDSKFECYRDYNISLDPDDKTDEFDRATFATINECELFSDETEKKYSVYLETKDAKFLVETYSEKEIADSLRETLARDIAHCNVIVVEK